VSLEQLWAGWRNEYVTSVSGSSPHSDDGSVFCRIASQGDPDAQNGIVWRDELVFVVLNAYPYASGHLLVMPVRHMAGLEDLEPAESAELWETMRRAASVLHRVYEPDGLNLGANLGRAAGAGIPRHLHLHALPRWAGDTNFMTSVGGVRVMPEPLDVSWQRLHPAFAGAGRS